MARGLKGEVAGQEAFRDGAFHGQRTSLFFERGDRPLLRRGIALAVAAVAVVGAIWALEGNTGTGAVGIERAGEVYDVNGRLLPAPVSASETPQIGRPAPDFVLTDLNGQVWQLSGLRGKAVVVNFWASWCPPCRAEMPELASADERYRDQGVLVVGINLEEDVPEIARFGRLLDLHFPLLPDPQGKAVAAYNVVALPSTFFIDRNGVISDINVGALNEKTLETKLQRLMQ